MINSTRIKERMKQMKVTQAQLAGKLGIKAPTMNQKLNNVRPMFLHEADIVAKELGIGPELFCAYFFWNEIA